MGDSALERRFRGKVLIDMDGIMIGGDIGEGADGGVIDGKEARGGLFQR